MRVIWSIDDNDKIISCCGSIDWVGSREMIERADGERNRRTTVRICIP